MSPKADITGDDKIWERMQRDAQQLSPIQKLGLIRQLTESLQQDWTSTRTPLQQAGAVPANLVKLNTDDLTYQLIDSAMQVHRAKGPGYHEDTYQRDLETHLTASNILFTPQKLLEVYDSLQSARLIGYYVLAVSGCAVSLLFNFGERSLEWKRVLPSKDVQEHKVNRQRLFVSDWLREG